MSAFSDIVRNLGFDGTATSWLEARPRNPDNPNASGWERKQGTWNPDTPYPRPGHTRRDLLEAYQSRYGGELGVGYTTDNAGPHGALSLTVEKYLPPLISRLTVGGDVPADPWINYDLRYVDGLSQFLWGKVVELVTNREIRPLPGDERLFTITRDQDGSPQPPPSPTFNRPPASPTTPIPPPSSPTTPPPPPSVNLSPVPSEILTIANGLTQLVAKRQREKVGKLVEWIKSVEGVRTKGD